MNVFRNLSNLIKITFVSIALDLIQMLAESKSVEKNYYSVVEPAG